MRLNDRCDWLTVRTLIIGFEQPGRLLYSDNADRVLKQPPPRGKAMVATYAQRKIEKNLISVRRF